MAMQKATLGTIAAVMIGVAAIALVSGLLATNRLVQNTGIVKSIGVEVYWDQACTNKTTSINWGTLDAGGVKTYNVYVKNNGTAAESLSMTTSNWSPASASSQISLSWNCSDYVLAHASVVGASLTLSVSSSISGITSFSFDITVTGTENT
jgi:hypothetical protein